MARLWKTNGEVITRDGVLIAWVAPCAGHQFGWGWRNSSIFERFGFKDVEAAMRDVMYFYRYNPPRAVFKFTSGRKVVVSSLLSKSNLK